MACQWLVAHSHAMRLFKYLTETGTKVLETCELKASDPREFNDPFEFCPQVETDIPVEAVEKKLQDRDFLENIHKRLPAIRQKHATLADFLHSIENEKPRWVDFFLKRFSEPRQFCPDTVAEIAARHVGVICFSQVFDDILMWSHYANCHRGMVIEFDEATFGKNLDAVEYENERPRYSPVFDVGTSDHLVRVTKRKAKQWAYEKEVRLLVPWDLTNERELDKDRRIRTLAIPPANILSVMLGCMATHQTASEVKSILSEDRFKRVRLLRMKRDLKQFKLHAVDE